MGLHFRAWNEALKPWGGVFSEEAFYELAGIPLKRTVEILNERQGLAMPPATIEAKKEQLYFDLMHTLEVIPEVEAVIHKFAGRIPFAVVSGSPYDSVVKSLTQVNLIHHFPVIVGGDQVLHGKPAPEGFLRAAEKLGVAPSDCLVFEDADLGIQAAEAAGMEWVKIERRALQFNR